MNLNILQQKINNLQESVSSTKGKLDLSEEQFVSSTEKLEELKELQEINSKAIEILNLIQHQTRDKIKEVFENVVTKALCYIYQSNDYQFELLFDRHGNTPKMTFLLHQPNMQEKHDILQTTAGGARDIISLALRFVLLEVSKVSGFIFLDEIDKRLDNPETERKMLEFILENQKASKRQIFLISHKQSFIDAIPKPIIFKKKMSTITKCPVENGLIQKVDNNVVTVEDKEVIKRLLPTHRKRGRPKSGSKKENAT